MPKFKNVIVELDYAPELHAAATESRTIRSGAFAASETTVVLETPSAPAIPGLVIDPTFGVAQIPREGPDMAARSDDGRGFALESALEPEASTFIMRGVINEELIESSMAAAGPGARIYSDPFIEPCLICPGSGPLGTDATVARLLCVPNLASRKMTGTGVALAVVDTGFNLNYLRAHGKNPRFDAARSWVPRPGLVPGNLPVSHGTMCAFDALIAAPQVTLLDIAVLLSTRSGGSVMDGLLSDAVLAYSHLLRVFASRRPGDFHSMVVTNSWGMFNPSWDFPVGNPGNYSDNPNHPFNRIVATLARAGADILFAAGNCGKDCPDGRCGGIVNGGIYGANSHPEVLSVGGVDVTKALVGYSTRGPGRLEKKKPDIASYTHFKGSGVYAADGGTSAATPVAAGVVAAFRSVFRFQPGVPRTYPAAIRNVIRKTAEDRGPRGFDFDYGYGIINGCRLAALRSLPILAPEEEGLEITETGAPAEIDWKAADEELAALQGDITDAGRATAITEDFTAAAEGEAEPDFTESAEPDFEEALVPPCTAYLPLLKRILVIAQSHPDVRKCLCYYICRKGPKPQCSRTALQLVTHVRQILAKCPQYRAPFCRALHCA